MSEVFHSIFSSVDALLYRCKNDEDYTMIYLEGGVEALTGYRSDDLLGNRMASWVGITHPDDKEQVFAEVDAAIEARQPWDLSYRLVSKSNQPVWVRERGNAIFEGDTLTNLQGLVVSAKAETDLRENAERVAAETLQANQEIVELAQKITSSVRQLSLLSVNARIEAARSGPLGAGFGVVANEIKMLADDNGKWASVITEKLS